MEMEPFLVIEGLRMIYEVDRDYSQALIASMEILEKFHKKLASTINILLSTELIK